MIFYGDRRYRSGLVIAYYWFMAALLFASASASLADDKYSTGQGFKSIIIVSHRGVVARTLAGREQNKVFHGISGSLALSEDQQKIRRTGTPRRRTLRGPGSAPARCLAKCGNCTPCTPVRVRIQPGATSTDEYYPEAWRCKCRKKLYMP